jgi:hypothetical protein
VAGDVRPDGVAWIGRAASDVDVVAAFEAVRALRAAMRTGGGLDARRTVMWLAERAAAPVLVVAAHDGGVALAASGLRNLYAPASTGRLQPLVPADHPLLLGRGGSLTLAAAPPALLADDGPLDLGGRLVDDVLPNAAEVQWTVGSTAI